MEKKQYRAGAFPERVTLELTNRCNISCVFCPRKYMEKERGDMDVQLARRLIDEIAEHAPVQVVPFFRGEPLLHPRWDEVLSYLKEKKTGEIQFATNATLLSENNVERLLDLELDFVSFSMDTVDVDIYNRNRRGADYETCLENVLCFLEEKTRRGVPTLVQVSSVATEEHRPRIDEFVEFWRGKVDRVRIYTEHSGIGGPGSIDRELPAFDSRLACRKVFTDTVVLWDGRIALCNHDWASKYASLHLPNVGCASIEEIWNSEEYREIRDKHTRGEVEALEPCRDCDHWKMYYLEEGVLGSLIVKED